MPDINSAVKLVVPFGPNRGEVLGCGVVVARRHSGIDGWELLVDCGDGPEWHAESWCVGFYQ